MEQITWNEMSDAQKNALKKINGDFVEGTSRVATKCAWTSHSVSSSMQVFHNLLGIEKTYDGSQISLNCAVNFVAHLTDENCEHFVKMVNDKKAFEEKGQEKENKLYAMEKEKKEAQEALDKVKARHQREQRRLVAENLAAASKIGLYRRQQLITMLADYSQETVVEIQHRLATQDLASFVEYMGLVAVHDVHHNEDAGSMTITADSHSLETEARRRYNDLIHHWGQVNGYGVRHKEYTYDDED